MGSIKFYLVNGGSLYENICRYDLERDFVWNDFVNAYIEKGIYEDECTQDDFLWTVFEAEQGSKRAEELREKIFGKSEK